MHPESSKRASCVPPAFALAWARLAEVWRIGAVGRRPPLARVLGDRANHPCVCKAAAQHARHRLPDLRLGRPRILIEKRFRREDDAAQAEAALRGLLVDEPLLDWVWILGCSE